MLIISLFLFLEDYGLMWGVILTGKALGVK